MLSTTLIQQHTGKVILVNPLLYKHDRRILWIILPAQKSGSKPIENGRPLDLRDGILGLVRVVDQDDIATSAR